MGISTLQSYRGAQIFEAIGLEHELIDQLLHLDGVPHRGHRPRRDRARERRAAPPRLRHRPVPGRRARIRAGSISGGAAASTTCINPETIAHLQHAVRDGSYAERSSEFSALIERREPEPLHAARTPPLQDSGSPIPIDEVEPAQEIVKRFKTGAMSLRLDQPRGAREPGDRHEPHRRQVEHRRGWRGSGALRARRERRLPAQRDQAGRVGPLRRDQLLPGQRRRAADQDGAGREAGRGRPASRPQGRRLHRARSATRRRASA